MNQLTLFCLLALSFQSLDFENYKNTTEQYLRKGQYLKNIMYSSDKFLIGYSDNDL